MACTCGNPVASNARSCPRCGKRFTSPIVKALAWFFGFAIFGSIIMAMIRPSVPVSQADQHQKAQEEHQFQLAVAGAKQVRDAMRNPDSFKLSSVLFTENGSVCYEYHAQNGFGGMNAGYAVLTDKGTIKTNEMDGGTKLWNRQCANKIGFDKTWVVDYAIGK
jgi:hypothetical protein